MRQIVTYRADERPDVEVELDGLCYPGELRMWRQDDHGSWTAQVTWRRRPGENHIGDFPRDRVRELPDPDRRRTPADYPAPG